jgi:hypothetical protein
MKVITEEYITIKEAAKLMNRSTRTIQRYIDKGLFDSRQFPPDTGQVYVRKLDIPSYLRK